MEIRSNAEALEELRWKKFPVLSSGFVTLVDCMGDDSSVVQAARVSYGAGTKAVSDDETLIRYLMRLSHTTPSEMCELKFLVRVPMDCWRQWIRHRMSSTNEYSTRYSEAIDAMDVTDPTRWRSQSDTNKQGSSGYVTEWPEKWRSQDPQVMYTHFGPIDTERSNCSTVGNYLTGREEYLHEIARTVYKERLDAGIAREQARKDLPLSCYTEAYWKIDLHNLFHFLRLRMDPHAQLEIRSYANIIGYEIVAKLFPASWRAFCDYRLNAITLSATDQKCLKEMLSTLKLQDVQHDIDVCFLNKREKTEFVAKLRKIGILEQEP